MYSSHTYWYRAYIILVFAITLLFCVTLAGPYQALKKEKDKRNGVDIEIVFDLSYSMMATDILPNRLEVAKEVLVSFIGELKNDRVWLVLFAGKPFQSVPLTYDYIFLQEFLKNINVDTIAQQYERFQGTAIGDGLVLGSSIFPNDDTKREKVMILITDGEANKWVDPELALKLLKDKNIKTYTVGVWKAEETTITVPGFWGFPQKVGISGVDENLLKKIAAETWGLYFKADSRTTFREIFDTIAKLEKKELEIEIYEIEKSLSSFFTGLILLYFLGLGYILFFKKIRL